MRRECERGETMKVVEYKDGKTNYRVMTPEEVAELEAMQTEMPEPQPAPEQRLDVLEPTTDDLVEIIADQEYRLCLMELGVTNEEVNAE